MKKLIFATNNEHKVEEIRNKLGGIFEISTLKEIGCTEEIPEDSGTLEGNALQKAHYLYNNYGCNCLPTRNRPAGTKYYPMSAQQYLAGCM